MKSVVFFLKPDGSCTGVYDDVLPGAVSVRDMVVIRASNVEFDNTRKMWYALDYQGRDMLCWDVTREGCLRQEAEMLTRDMERDLTSGDAS